MTDVEAKRASLQATGTLNRHPEAVTDPLFRTGGFFDPHDLMQVRYEMVRRHQVEGMPVATAAALFGVSLPTAYQAQTLFDTGGLAGLLPKRRCPKQGHKLTPDVIAYIDRRRQEQADLRMSQLLIELQQTFGLVIHRRSLERLLNGKKRPCQSAVLKHRHPLPMDPPVSGWYRACARPEATARRGDFPRWLCRAAGHERPSSRCRG